MTKKTLLYIFIFTMFVATIKAQNYQAVKRGAEFYFANKKGQVACIKIDSFATRNRNADTIFVNYKVFDVNVQDKSCYTTRPSWIGKHIYQKNKTYTYFFNYLGDTFKIKNDASRKEKWQLYKDKRNYWMEATMQGTIDTMYMGIRDSVKIISLLAYQNKIPLLNDRINKFRLLLSKKNGLYTFFDAYSFPDTLISYYLIGRTNPKAGKVNLNVFDVYNLNQGDELHVYSYNYIGNDILEEAIDSIKTILSKTISTNKDTITFKYKLCMRKQSIGTDMWLDSFDSTIYVDDTLKFKIILSSPQYAAFNLLPNQHFVYKNKLYYTEMYINYDIDAYGGKDRLIKYFIEPSFKPLSNQCMVKNPNLGITILAYAEGLGGPYFKRFGVGEFETILQYYKKGIEEWGVPMQCDSLICEVAPSVHIYPNPMQTNARIRIQGEYSKIYTFTIYSYMGVKIKSYDIKANSVDFSIDNIGLPIGLYIYTLSDKYSTLNKGKFVVE